MRTLSLLPLVFPFLLFGQVDTRSPHAGLGFLLEALAGASSEADREVASETLKDALMSVLRSDSAFTARFAGVPLSHVDAPDGSFRLFTWNYLTDDGHYRYAGLLLVRSRQGGTIHELHDRTEAIRAPEQARLDASRWYGAVYYSVVPVRWKRKTYYTLLGWKGYDRLETRKVIELLSLEGSTPRFGVPLFTGEGQRLRRRIFGFTAEASMLLRWEPAQRAIILDHLSPTRPELVGQAAFMAPDLSYDSYTWNKGRWEYHRDVDIRNKDRGKPYKAPPPESR